MMKHAKKILIVLVLLFVIGFAFALFTLRREQQQTGSAQTSTEGVVQTNSIAIQNTDGSQLLALTVPHEPDQTALDLLTVVAEQNNILVETIQYDFGMFVQSINGQESGAEQAWIYYVNDQSASVGADQYTLQPGDRILWKYENVQQ